MLAKAQQAGTTVIRTTVDGRRRRRAAPHAPPMHSIRPTA
jgi:hypothetical protein